MQVKWDEPNIAKGKAEIENYEGSKNIYLMPIARAESHYVVTFKEVLAFLESRCVPRTRFGIDALLRKSLNLSEYDPYVIAKHTHGVKYTDFIWLQFGEERITYDDIKIR